MRKIILSVFAFVFIYASDVRFAGMGNLSFIFEDDMHKLNLYDFAGISAGLFRIDSISSVLIRASGLKEIWQKDSLTYFSLGQALPQRLTDYAPVEAVSFYETIPQFPMVPSELIYTSSQLEETYDEWGNLKAPRSWRIYAGYSQLTRRYLGDTLADIIKTPTFSGVYSRPISKSFDYGITGDLLYALYNSADNQDEARLLPPGCGGSIAFNNPWLSIGLNGNYHYPMFEFKRTYLGHTRTERFDGHAISPILGAVVKGKNITWASALNYKWISLAGRYNTSSLGNLKLTGYSAKSMALFVPNFARLAFFVEHNNKTPIYIDKDGDKWFESAYKDYTVGIGAGGMIKNLSAGLEGIYKYNLIDDKIADSTIAGSDYVIKSGVEYSFINNLFIRGGYNYNRFDPNLDETDDNMFFHIVTTGLGMNLIKNIRVDISYNYKLGKTDSDPEEKITDHIIALYCKYWLKSAR